MTSISQQSQIPSQASNSSSASQSAQSYASTAKKAVTSPPVATGSSVPSPAVAVGGSAPVQHGKSSSISPVNGRSSISPAVPVVSGPAIAHSSSAANGGATDHSRKSSVTISATGPNGYVNGGPVGGSKSGIQFGSITDSPAASHSVPQTAQPAASAPVPIPSNPRVTSPAQSPSPIPQPSASGGRPPSGLTGQGNGMTFGSLGGDGDRHMRQASGTQGPLAPGNQQTGHLRRESSQSTQGDMSGSSGPGTNPGRGGFPPQGGRGRGGFNPQFQQQQMGYPPGNSQFRNTSSGGRGAMAAPFQGQGRMPNFPNSPHQATRSPALTPAMPGTPNMNQSMPPIQSAQQYGYGYPHMQPQPVNNPSSYNHQSDSSKFNSHRGSKRGKSWRHDEKYSGRKWRDSSKEFFQIPREQMLQPDQDSYDQRDMRIFTMPVERGGRPHLMQQSHTDEPSTPALLDRRIASADQSPGQLPLPPPLAGVPRFDHSAIDLSPASHDFDIFLTRRQNYASYQTPGYDPRGMPMGNAPYMYPQMQYMNPGGPPQSPQPGYQQPNAYIPGQYAPQPMSRNSSQMSADQRPASSMGQPQTPSMAPSVSHPHTPQPQPKANATPSTSFSRPARKSAAIVIKRPDGEAIDVEGLKAPASPAPSNRTRTPPVIASTPTPPPKSSTPQHARTDSGAVKSKEQIQKEIQDAVKQKVAAEKSEKAAESIKAEEAAKAAEEKKLKEAEEAKAEAEAKAAEEAKQAKEKEEAEAKAAAEKAKQDEEDELERQIREMEEAEAEREKKEAEIMAKRAAEKAKQDEANRLKREQEAEENDRKLKEQEREMERIEDERERKRQEAEARGVEKVDIKAELKKDLKALTKEDAPTTPSTLASKLSNLTLGSESGASTPASDDSMGPPPKVNVSEKRGKPAALNLAPLNTKPVEPPQPSAALQSLKSARFLTAINPAIYPKDVSSPNPALNNAVTNKGKNFKYDKEFLLQFQKVFTEKPSMEFESQIKALIGDPEAGSARSASTRTSGMGPRSGSTRGGNPPGAFAMGQFGAGGVGGKTLPPGTTSDQRFAMSTGSMPRPAMNPMNSFSRPGGAFPGGSSMARTPSSQMYNAAPNSPRQQSKRGNNSRRDNHTNNAKAEAQAAKTMPLTAGMELKPIQVSATGWKPRSVGQAATGSAGPAPGGAGHMEPDMVQRKVKAALNKMTPEKFDKIADQILAIAAQSKDEADGRTLRQVIQLTFEKATDEAHWASMYAKFCKRMLETMSPDIKDESILDKNGNIVSGGNLFRKYLLNRCQEEFERGWKTDLPEKPEGAEDDKQLSAEAAMLSDEYYIAAAAKRRGLGLVQFIGELYKLSMLTERIMHECVKKLVDYTGIPDEAEIESLTKLLRTIGANLDSTEKGKPMMDVYFTRIQTMIDTPELPSRLKFMLMDVVDLRKKHWASKEADKGPKTLEEVRSEVEAANAQKAAESARGSQRGGGGGGRIQLGRGDSRNFSGQYGNQPPVDYQKNIVGMDDLRRLTNKGGANRNSSAQMSFGPTSMFSSRSNSGRKLGPGGSLSRTGEDSGASSRTGTPPQQKEKESATSANAFSLLAGLGSGEAEHPGSPPSTSVSPALSKATPAPADKSEDKKGSES